MHRYNKNYRGNISYLGVPHGTDQYIEHKMDELYNKIQKKVIIES